MFLVSSYARTDVYWIVLAWLRLCYSGKDDVLYIVLMRRSLTQLISREEAAKWFADVVPTLAKLLLRLPSLLESHYQNTDNLRNGVKTGFRLLGPQEAGVVFLGQVSPSV